MVASLFENKKCLETLTEPEAIKWVLKVYRSMVEASGLKATRSLMNTAEKKLSKIGNGGMNSSVLSKSVQEFATTFNNPNQSTVSSI